MNDNMKWMISHYHNNIIHLTDSSDSSANEESSDGDDEQVDNINSKLGGAFALALGKAPPVLTKEEEKAAAKKANKQRQIKSRNENRLEMKRGFVNYLKSLEDTCGHAGPHHHPHKEGPEQGHGLAHAESMVRAQRKDSMQV